MTRVTAAKPRCGHFVLLKDGRPLPAVHLVVESAACGAAALVADISETGKCQS